MQNNKERRQFLQHLTSYITHLTKPVLLFDATGTVIGSSNQYNDCLGVKGHYSVFNTLSRKHKLLASQYVQQVRQVIETGLPISTFDFYCATLQRPAIIIQFQKSAVINNGELVGVVFDGVKVSDADKMLGELLKLPTAEPGPTNFKVSATDAHLLLLLRSGYNSRQASEIINITHKAANKRLERIMSQLGVKDRKSLLEIMRSEVGLNAIYGALVGSSISVKIDVLSR